MSELQSQQQQQMAAMQQQFTAEKQQMLEQMQRMVQEHQQLEQLHAALVSSSGSSSSSSSPPPPPLPTSSTPRIDIRVMSPPPFYGTSGSNAHQWLMEVERYFLAVNLGPDAQRVLYASTLLKDAASVWYYSASQEMGVSPSWDDFKARFLSRFQPIAAAKVARAQLRLLKQRVRVAGYSQEFLRLVQLIPDMNLPDQLESYMVGLHQDLAIEVEKKDPKSLLEAMEFAQRIELMTSGRRQAYGRLPAMHHFSRSSSSQHRDDPMEISAIHQVDDAHDFFYGAEHLPSPADTSIADTVEHVLRLNGMFQRGGGSGGFKRGGMRSNGPRRGGGSRLPSSSSHGSSDLSKEEFNQLLREGKCFKCKSTGHLARYCTATPQSKN